MSGAAKKLDTAVDAFTERANQIVTAFRNAPKKGTTPFDSRWGTFRRDAYRLIRTTKSSSGGHRVIKSVVRTFDRVPSKLLYNGNEFNWGLRAIDPDEDVMDEKRLSLLALQLTYADIHEVPAHYLVGFLYQSGSSASTSRKLKAGLREPWYRA